jgi:hypothetical protein
MEMAPHLYLETISEICGALLSLPFTPSRHATELHKNFNFYKCILLVTDRYLDEILGLHGSENADYGLLSCVDMCIRRNLFPSHPPPSSR